MVTPAGKVRVRFMAGSLVVANGELPAGAVANVPVTLGYMQQAGVTWFVSGSAGARWGHIASVHTWKYYFYREHVQVQVLPLAVLLVAPWVVRRWARGRRPPWACAACGYDLRGAQGTCPECGVVSPRERG